MKPSCLFHAVLLFMATFALVRAAERKPDNAPAAFEVRQFKAENGHTLDAAYADDAMRESMFAQKPAR